MGAQVVSVIIPTYNRAEKACRAIQSALEQTYETIEIIVIDDGSTDGTRERVLDLFGTDSRITFVRQENRGVSCARNRGLQMASGDFIGLLDSDDIWKPWKVEVQVASMAYSREAGMVWSDMEAIGPGGELLNPRFLKSMYSSYRLWKSSDLFSASYPLRDIVPARLDEVGDRLLFVGDIFSPMIMGNLVHTSTVLLRRERLAKVGGFREDLSHSGEDFDFHLRTCREGPVAFVDLATIQYQTGMPDRLTSAKYMRYVAENFLKTIEPIIDRDRSRISLSKRQIDHVMAHAHGWVGEQLVRCGDGKQARFELRKSLRYQVWQPRVWTFLVESYLPVVVRKFCRDLLRRIRSQQYPGWR